jgi:lipopolysaccharide exporter
MNESNPKLSMNEAYVHMARGSAWMIAMRWAIRGIGVFSVAILARLLTPEDFGLIAIGMIFVALAEALAESGQRYAVIRDPEASSALLNTAWTLSALQGMGLCALLFISAPLAGLVVESPATTAVLRLLALRPLILGFQNIGTVAFRREFAFHKEFALGIYEKIGGLVVSITLAATLRSYWALAFGIVAAAAIRVALSYWMHPYRPSFSLERLTGLYAYSTSILVQSLTRVAESRVDQLLVGFYHGTAILGRYNVANEVASAPTAEMAMPMAAALFPVYAKLQWSPVEAGRAYLTSLSVVATLAIATGGGVSLIANEFVLLLLGPQWTESTPLVRLIAVAAAAAAISNSALTPLNAIGKERVARHLALIRLACLAGGLAVVAPFVGAEQVALARVVVMLASIPLFLIIASRTLGVSWWAGLMAVWRPALAAVAMAGAVFAVPADLVPILWTRLLTKVICGAIGFIGASLILVWYFGQPNDWERIGVRYLRSAVRRLKK